MALQDANAKITLSRIWVVVSDWAAEVQATRPLLDPLCVCNTNKEVGPSTHWLSTIQTCGGGTLTTV